MAKVSLNERRVPLLDRARAKVQFEWLSALCCKFPDTIGRRIVGPNPVQWLVVKQHADSIDWRTCNGDPDAPLLPAGFTKGMALQTKEQFPPFDRRHAAAFPVGKAVVAAAVPEGARQVIMGVGKGEELPGYGEPQFRGTIGALDVERRDFIQDHTIPGGEVGSIVELQFFPGAQRV